MKSLLALLPLAAVALGAFGCAHYCDVTTEPSGAAVFCDGVRQGATPTTASFSEKLGFGTYHLRVEKDGYVAQERFFKERGLLDFSYIPRQIHFDLQPSGKASLGVPEPETPSARMPAPSELAGKWAVVVGLSRYAHGGDSGLTELAYAHADAKAFRDTLVEQGWPEDHIRFLVDKNATKAEVEKWLRYGPDLENAVFVFFWAGHGYPDPLDQRKLFLACHDTTLENPGTGLRMSDVRHWLEERKARNVVVIADACHAGGLITGRGTGETSARGLAVRMKPKQVPPGWVYLLGAKTADKAFEHPSLKGGLFTTSLVDGMKGAADGYGLLGRKDGAITIGELREYVRDKVKEKAFKLNLTGAFEIEDQTNTGDKNVWDLTLQAK